MSNLKINGNLEVAGGGFIDSKRIATEEDINNIGKTVTQIGYAPDTNSIPLSQPITNFRFIWLINNRSSSWRNPFFFPAQWLNIHYGEELCLESWDGSRYRCQFDNATTFKINAEHYSGDVYIYGIN